MKLLETKISYSGFLFNWVYSLQGVKNRQMQVFERVKKLSKANFDKLAGFSLAGKRLAKIWIGGNIPCGNLDWREYELVGNCILV